MKIEYCFFFKATKTKLGTMPAHHMIVSAGVCRDWAIKSGGIDVSDNPLSWYAAEKELNELNDNNL